MKTMKKKVISLMLTLSLVLGIIASPMQVSAADRPNAAGTPYIKVYDNNENVTIIYSTKEVTTTTEGVTYNEGTNTLTITDYTGMYIETNEMGDDFTLVVKGTCYLQFILVYGYGHGGGLTIAGDGTLNIRNDDGSGILLRAEGAKSNVTITKGPRLNIQVANGEYAIYVEDSTASQQIIFEEGVASTYSTVTKKKEIRYSSLTDNYGERVLPRVTKNGEYYLADPWSYTDGTFGIEMLKLTAYGITYVETLAWDGAEGSIDRTLNAAGYYYDTYDVHMLNKTNVTIRPINLVKAKVTKVAKITKNSATVTVGKVTDARGFEIRYSTKKNMAGAKKIQTTTLSTKLTKLTKNKTYYVQVRAFSEDASGNKIYGAWSTVKSFKTKAK